jgi:5'-nucleotidase
MRILCTNDDGINAEGLAVLEKIARAFTDDVWVVAPESEQSGASRALSLSAPVRVREAGAKRFAVMGTPSDCVAIAVLDLMDVKPDLVLSGVNRGQNIADDITISGTVAGAMQGLHFNIPSMALSQARGFRANADPSKMYDTSSAFGAGVVGTLLKAGWPEQVLININFPDRDPDETLEVEVTSQGKRDQQILYTDKRTDPRGQVYYWFGFKGVRSTALDGTDLKAIYEGRISVTPLHVDLSHQPALNDLKKVLGGAAPRGAGSAK